MKEVWQPVRGYEGLYEVSDLGKVRSLPRRKRNGVVWAKKPSYIRKTPIGAQGYPVVDLKHNGHRKTFTVHTLVLTAFVAPRPPGQECRHLNGIRADSRLCNLAWGTPSENDQDRKRHGTFIQGKMHSNARLTEHDVQIIRSMQGSQATIAKQFAISQSLVSMIRAGQRWAHVQ
jgi:hypothetical protein